MLQPDMNWSSVGHCDLARNELPHARQTYRLCFNHVFLLSISYFLILVTTRIAAPASPPCSLEAAIDADTRMITA